MKKALILMIISTALFIYGAYTGLVLLPPIGKNPSTSILYNNYRIIFFHVPSAITAYLAFTVTLISAIIYLKSRNVYYDVISVSSAKVGFFMITAALISGSIWAKAAWGAYWNWDPRETTILILWAAYAAYFAIRASIEDEAEKAKVSAILSVFCYATIPLSYLSTKLFFSLHPTTQSLDLGPNVGRNLGIMIISFLCMYVAFMILDVKLTLMEHKLEVER